MIELQHVTKWYVKRKKITLALHDINLTLGERGLVCLVGESGCGKTTLLNMLGALDSPTDGDVYVNGKKLGDMNGKERQNYHAGSVGFIFQELNLIESLSVRDNLLLVCDKEDFNGKYAAVLQKLQIDEFADKLPKELSGGQRQRVAIARAIVKGSRVLLCDEPTGSLDPDNAVIIFETLKEISRERLVVVVSHDIATASKYADRMIRLHRGTVQSDTANEQENGKGQESAPQVQTSEKAARPKVKQRVRGLFGLSLRYIKCKPGRLTVMTVLMVFIFFVFSVASSLFLYSPSQTVARGMHKYNVRCFSVWNGLNAAPFQYPQYDRDFYIPFTEEDVEDLRQKTGTQPDIVYDYFVSDYSNLGEKTEACRSMILFNGGYENNWGVYALTQDFMDRYGFTLHGAMPTTADQVVLTTYALSMYMYRGYRQSETELLPVRTAQDLIGKRIVMQDEQLGERTFTVSGVLDTGFKTERYLYECDDRTGTLLTEYDEGVVYGSVHTVMYISEPLMQEVTAARATQEASHIPYVLLPAKKMKTALRYLRACEKSFAPPLGMTHQEQSEILTVNYRYYQLKNEVTCSFEEESDTLLRILSKILHWVVLGLSVIAVLVIFQYFSALLSGREKDVGVLRTGGYTKGEIALLFIFEALLVSAGIIVLSTVLSAIGVTVGARIFAKVRYLLFTPMLFGIKQVGIIIGVQLLFSLLGILLPLLLLLRKKPMQIINAGK